MNDRMRWNCKEKGKCYRDLCPRLSEFDDCFPGRIGFGDVDGIVEINGKALILEWKSQPGALPTGQKIMYQRLSEGGVVVYVVTGDPKEMRVDGISRFVHGKYEPVDGASIELLKYHFTSWSNFAKAKQSS